MRVCRAGGGAAALGSLFGAWVRWLEQPSSAPAPSQRSAAQSPFTPNPNPPLTPSYCPRCAGANCHLRNCVVDENTTIGDNVQLVNKEGVKEADRSASGGWRVSGGGQGGRRCAEREHVPETLCGRVWDGMESCTGCIRRTGHRVDHGWLLCHLAPGVPARATGLPLLLGASMLRTLRLLCCADGYMIQDGIIVVMRGASIKPGTVI